MLGKCRKSLTDMAVDISPQWGKKKLAQKMLIASQNESRNAFSTPTDECLVV